MADKPADKNVVPGLLPQNPAPFGEDSQPRKTQVRGQVDRIMAAFLQVLPSNYVSQITGPLYTIQFQAAAERIADFQVTAQEIFSDSGYDYTRSEVLYQIIGAMVFPDAGLRAGTGDWPSISGDLTYREFLQRMVELLLAGATTATIKSGVELLTDGIVQVLEKSVAARTTPGSAWTWADQHTFEISVTDSRTITVGGVEITLEDFPEDPFTFVNNLEIVMRALKPAHTLYDFRFLFTENFAPFFSDSMTLDMETYYYQDWRRYCLGSRQITGTEGVSLNDRTLFSDATRDFAKVLPGADLFIEAGPNSSVGGRGQIGHYVVDEVRAFPVGDDATARAYTTVSGLSGTVTVAGDVLTDTSQNWALAPEGDILTITEGSNAGSYRLKTLVGLNGGPVGTVDGTLFTFTQVRVAHSILRLQTRMPVERTDQSYTVQVDRLGVQVPRSRADDVSSYFFR